MGGLFDRRVEENPDGVRMLVRDVSGARAVKRYRCPGCDQVIEIGVPHVVAWPEDDFGGAAERRHWHRSCWQARGRRGAQRRR